MNNFRYKFSQFMQGRYGMDQLYYALLVLYLILLLLNIIFRRVMIFGILAWVVLIFAFYRFFSRNISKRSRENDKFMQLFGKLTGGRLVNFGGFNGGGFTGDGFGNSGRSGSNGPGLMTKIR